MRVKTPFRVSRGTRLRLLRQMRLLDAMTTLALGATAGLLLKGAWWLIERWLAN